MLFKRYARRRANRRGTISRFGLRVWHGESREATHRTECRRPGGSRIGAARRSSITQIANPFPSIPGYLVEEQQYGRHSGVDGGNHCCRSIAWLLAAVGPAAFRVRKSFAGRCHHSGILRTISAICAIRPTVNLDYGAARFVNFKRGKQGVSAVPIGSAPQGLGRGLIEEASPYRQSAEIELSNPARRWRVIRRWPFIMTGSAAAKDQASMRHESTGTSQRPGTPAAPPADASWRSPVAPRLDRTGGRP